MKLSYKVSMTVIGVQSVLTAVLIYYANGQFSEYVGDIEKTSASRIQERFNAALSSELTHVRNRVNDWSNWDEPYNFILGRAPEFEKKNMNDYFLKVARLNHFVFYDIKGQPVKGFSAYSPWDRWQSTSPELIRFFGKMAEGQPAGTIADVARFGDRIIVWSMAPVTNSEANVPPCGYILMARELDHNNSPEFTAYFGYDYQLLLSPSKAGAPAGSFGVTHLELTRLSSELLSIHFPLRSAKAENLMVVQVQVPRSENIVADRTREVFFGITIAMVVTGILLTYILIHFLIIKRLTRVTQEIPRIFSSDDRLLSITASRDEIHEFCEFFNTSIRRFREQVEKNHETQLAMSHSAQLSSIGEITGSIVHEIKNPLSILTLGMTHLRQLVGTQDQNQGEIPSLAQPLRVTDLLLRISKLEETVKRITKIINIVSRFSRRDSGKRHQMYSVQELLNDALFLMTAKLNRQNVEFRRQISEEAFVTCQPALMALVLGNLISNSLDAIEGDENAWIEVAFGLQDNFYEISVTDSGKGLPDDFISRLKQPYFTTKGEGKGTGLGLSFSRKVMADHHGSLDYDAQSAHTRFVLKLPVKPEGLKATDPNQAAA